MKYFLCAVCAVALLAGCAQTKKTAPKEGREVVQSRLMGSVIEKSTQAIQLSAPQTISEWPLVNGNAQNKIAHAQISGFSKKVWTENVGSGIHSNHINLPSPVIKNDLIYTLDSKLTLTETDKNGDAIWDYELRPNGQMPAVASVGLAMDESYIYVVSGDGIVYAVEPHGEIVWEYDTNNILRSAPIVYNNKLYVLASNNELFVLNTKNGSLAWKYKNMETTTNLLGMGQPAVSKNIAVVPFSNGEIIAFNTETGTPIWSNTLLSYRTFNQIADLSHVLASPVIEDNIVYLVGNAHQMGGFNLKTGEPLFVTPIGGQTTPVIAGNVLFLITNKDTLVAMNKQDGSLIWEKDLYSKTQKQVAWHTPRAINNQIVVSSSEGDVIVFDMETGKETHSIKTEKMFVAPIAYDNGLLFYTNDADLMMYH